MKTEKEEEFISKTNLKQERNWTDKLIKTFLPEPDKLKPNPIYKSASPMQMYSLEKVVRIEKSKKFSELFNAAQKRKAIATKAAAIAVETKVQRVIDYSNAVQIQIPIFNKHELIKMACDSYNNFSIDRNKIDKSASAKSDWKFLKRICINYLRHNCTLYDGHLRVLKGKTGITLGHDILQNRIDDEIIKKYPYLGDTVPNEANS